MLSLEEMRGVYIVWDASRESLEDLIIDWDMIDNKPKRGKYTWTNRRVGFANILAKLDSFLINNSFIEEDLEISSSIIPSASSNNRPIILFLSKKRTMDLFHLNSTSFGLIRLSQLKLLNPSWKREYKDPQALFGSQSLKL